MFTQGQNVPHSASASDDYDFLPDGSIKDNRSSRTVANPKEALPIVSTIQQVQAVSQGAKQFFGQQIGLAPETVKSLNEMKKDGFLPKTNSGREVIDGFARIFSKYEVPIGLVTHLQNLKDYQLNFIIDDSGSMDLPTDALFVEAGPFMQFKLANSPRIAQNQGKLTRWQEAEDRLHIMMELLSYIPTGPITISFLNRPNVIRIDRSNKSPQEFEQVAHREIDNAFRNDPDGQTPLGTRLRQAIANNLQSKTMHYIFTDGEPNDMVLEEVINIAKYRDQKPFDINVYLRKQELYVRKQEALNNNNADALRRIEEEIRRIEEEDINYRNSILPISARHPLTFISCTDKGYEVEWIKDVDEDADFTAEVDDCREETKEVCEKQGPVFPYTKGIWLLCQLVGAICPEDLDALDESVPLTKKTLDKVMGRKLTPQEYQNYFEKNMQSDHDPKHPKSQYKHLFSQFAREDLEASDIVPNKRRKVNLNGTLTPSNQNSYGNPPFNPQYSSQQGYPNNNYQTQQSGSGYGYNTSQTQQGYSNNTYPAQQSGSGYGYNNPQTQQGYPNNNYQAQQSGSGYGYNNPQTQQGYSNNNYQAQQSGSGFGYNNQQTQQGYPNNNYPTQQGGSGYPNYQQNMQGGFPGSTQQNQLNQQGFFGRSNNPPGYGNTPNNGYTPANPGNPPQGYNVQTQAYNPGMFGNSNQPNQANARHQHHGVQNAAQSLMNLFGG